MLTVSLAFVAVAFADRAFTTGCAAAVSGTCTVNTSPASVGAATAVAAADDVATFVVLPVVVQAVTNRPEPLAANLNVESLMMSPFKMFEPSAAAVSVTVVPVVNVVAVVAIAVKPTG